MKKLADQLLQKSQEAFILALEIYNKPTIQYRIETFAFLFCNSWELLLKAKILHNEGRELSIYYKKQRNQPRRTLSLRDCLKRVLHNENDPVRRNIEDVIEIRDAAVHYLVPELEVIYQGLFQAGVLNYVAYIEDWFGLYVTEMCTPAMLSLLSNAPAIQPAKLRKKYGKEILEFIENETSRLNASQKEINSSDYRIPLEYRLVLTKSSKGADISLSAGPGETPGILVEVPKDLSKTHPFMANEIISMVQERLGSSYRFNSYDFQAVIFKEKVRKNPRLHYKLEKPDCRLYSERLIDFIVGKFQSDSSYQVRARSSYASYRHKLREAKRGQNSS